LFARTIKILKRWRDEHQSVRAAIKSIVLQVLVAEVMPEDDDDATRVAATFRSLHRQLSPLSAPPTVANPVLQFENLAASWSIQHFVDFVTELGEAVELLDSIEATDDAAEAATMWQELLGSDFPVPTAKELGLRLESTSHEQKPSERGWVDTRDGRYSVSIGAFRETKLRGRTMMRVRSGDTVPAGYDLRFKATVVAPTPVEVYWQVVNTGGDAASEAGGLRGEFFKGRGLENQPTRDQTENWEGTKYKGCHEIRALLVAGDQVVAASEYFKVPISKRRQH
jgi:hypothetical protein